MFCKDWVFRIGGNRKFSILGIRDDTGKETLTCIISISLMIINVRLWELLGLLEESTRSEWINQSARYFQIGYENWGLHVRTISVYVHHACASFIFPCSNDWSYTLLIVGSWSSRSWFLDHCFVFLLLSMVLGLLLSLSNHLLDSMMLAFVCILSILEEENLHFLMTFSFFIL